MANELFVSATEEGLQIAILENKKLVELHYEKKNSLLQVGDIFVGKAKKIHVGMNAVFVDIGYNKDAFLHYSDLGPQIRTQMRYLKSIMASPNNIVPIGRLTPIEDIDKHGKMSDVLRSGNTLLVQIMKEMISSKGPRLSSQISIAGQYIILLPFSNEISVSRKFRSMEEKRRLKQLLEGIRPAQMGIIVRTAAEGCDFSKIQAELAQLLQKWERIITEAATVRGVKKIYSEIDRTSSILRDMLSIGFDTIYTDDPNIYSDLQEYLAENQPDNSRNLSLKRGKQPLFEIFGIDRQIRTCFGKTVNLSNGSYLVIEHTEALHVFDVNSGRGRFTNNNPEENALTVNLEAATEVARQLRLRDMGGIIVVDFIDQKNPDNRRRIYEHLKNEMARDRARHTILPMSRFGLIQLTRQRVRPEVNIPNEESCPTCNGSGKIRPSILVADEINNTVDYLLRRSKIRKLKIVANPFVAAYFTTGVLNRQVKWFMRYGKWIDVVPNNGLAFSTIKYYDENNEEIKLD